MNTEQLFQALPEAAASALRTLFALPPPPPPPRPPSYKNMKVKLVAGPTEEQTTLIDAAMEAVSFPEQDKLTPLPESLTEAQRALALLLVDHYHHPIYGWAIPQSNSARRRWLGLDPQGVLEQETTFALGGAARTLPLWSALMLLNEESSEAGDDERERLWERLPLGERLEAYGDISLGAYDLNAQDFEAPLDWSTSDEGKTWALSFVERALPFAQKDTTPNPEVEIQTPLKQVLCLSLLRANIPFDRRWAPLIPISTKPKEAFELTITLLRSLQPEEQAATLLQNLDEMFSSQAIRTALALLQYLPSPELTRYVLDNCSDIDNFPKRDILQKLTEITSAHPALSAVVDPYIAALPPVKTLHWRSFLQPKSIHDLSAIQRAQCATGSGNIMGAGSDWVNEEEIDYLALGTLADEAGTPLYDTAIFMDEDGTIFKTGTTEPVAWLCQFSLDCEDPSLKEALQLALRNLPRTKEDDEFDDEQFDDEEE